MLLLLLTGNIPTSPSLNPANMEFTLELCFLITDIRFRGCGSLYLSIPSAKALNNEGIVVFTQK